MTLAISANERPLKAKSSVNASMMDLLAHDGKYFHESGALSHTLHFQEPIGLGAK